MMRIGVIAYVTPGAMFQVLRPKNKDEQHVCSVACVCHGLTILIGWIAYHEVEWSQFVFFALTGFFFFAGYFAEKIIYPLVVLGPVFDEPAGTEDHS